ncbi:hypothetical protein KSS87_000706 [Heliosperma pusillum]|nr:hypothetical protein KSS87_000706 [Heliosperma pusillum]
MGLLEKLWDDTLAGPHPDSGLGKLRKFNTFSHPPKDNEGMSGSSEGVKVTRSITIVRPPGYQHTAAGSAPASPAGSTPPVSPFSGVRDLSLPWRGVAINYFVQQECCRLSFDNPLCEMYTCALEVLELYEKFSHLAGNRSGAFRFRRRSTSDANEKAANEDGSSGSTPPP